jgi:amino acid permease
MTTIILTSIFSASLIYELVSILGYLSFGSHVTANIIAMYPSTTLFIAGGQLAIVILVMFSYPLQVHPCRICLDKVVLEIFGGDKDSMIAVPTTEEEAARHEENSEDEDSAGGADYNHGAHDETSLLRHTLLTAAITIPGFAIAYFVDSLQRGEFVLLPRYKIKNKPFSLTQISVLSVVGSTGSTTISFILPGIFFWKLFRDDPKEVFFVSLAKMLTLYGFCIMVFW